MDLLWAPSLAPAHARLGGTDPQSVKGREQSEMLGICKVHPRAGDQQGPVEGHHVGTASPVNSLGPPTVHAPTTQNISTWYERKVWLLLLVLCAGSASPDPSVSRGIGIFREKGGTHSIATLTHKFCELERPSVDPFGELDLLFLMGLHHGCDAAGGGKMLI